MRESVLHETQHRSLRNAVSISSSSTPSCSQFDASRLLRQEARRDLLDEAKKRSATKLLGEIPFIRSLRAALMVAFLQTPHRFHTRGQVWTHIGFGLDTHSSSEHDYVEGRPQRSKKQISIRRLRHSPF